MFLFRNIKGTSTYDELLQQILCILVDVSC